MMNTLSGTKNRRASSSSSSEYARGTANSGLRLSASTSMSSSPKILLRFPRFTSSTMKTYGRSSSWCARPDDGQRAIEQFPLIGDVGQRLLRCEMFRRKLPPSHGEPLDAANVAVLRSVGGIRVFRLDHAVPEQFADTTFDQDVVPGLD